MFINIDLILLVKMNLVGLMRTIVGGFQYRLKNYAGVEAKNLTLEQLIKLTERSSSFNFIVEFTSSAGRRYYLHHHKGDEHPINLIYEPKVVLASETPINQEDFDDVKRFIAEAVNAKSLEYIPIPDKSYLISRGPEGRPLQKCKMLLNEVLTPERIVSYIKAYQKHFGEVEITLGFFTIVPKRTYHNLGLTPHNSYAWRF